MEEDEGQSKREKIEDQSQEKGKLAQIQGQTPMSELVFYVEHIPSNVIESSNS
jgi:hypothetical protein